LNIDEPISPTRKEEAVSDEPKGDDGDLDVAVVDPDHV
jgi:hypothetical protein